MKLFQIYEDDLAELEQILPSICDGPLVEFMDPSIRRKFRRCKLILSNVRWNYGPHDNVEVIPVDVDDSGYRTGDCDQSELGE